MLALPNASKTQHLHQQSPHPAPPSLALWPKETVHAGLALCSIFFTLLSSSATSHFPPACGFHFPRLLETSGVTLRLNVPLPRHRLPRYSSWTGRSGSALSLALAKLRPCATPRAGGFDTLDPSFQHRSLPTSHLRRRRNNAFGLDILQQTTLKTYPTDPLTDSSTSAALRSEV